MPLIYYRPDGSWTCPSCGRDHVHGEVDCPCWTHRAVEDVKPASDEDLQRARAIVADVPAHGFVTVQARLLARIVRRATETRDLTRQVGLCGDCHVEPHISRVCERGTGACNVRHRAIAPAAETTVADDSALIAIGMQAVEQLNALSSLELEALTQDLSIDREKAKP